MTAADEWEQVENYLTETFDDAPGPGRFLELLARMVNAKRVLEIGTLDDHTTVSLARAVGESGRVVSLEADASRAARARADLDAADVGDRVEIVVGPAATTLHRVRTDDDSSFDLVYIVADGDDSAQYVEWALVLGRPGTIVVVADVVREGAVLRHDSTDPAVRGTRDVLTLLASHPRLDATAFQTVGSAGWNGLALALVLP